MRTLPPKGKVNPKIPPKARTNPKEPIPAKVGKGPIKRGPIGHPRPNKGS